MLSPIFSRLRVTSVFYVWTAIVFAIPLAGCRRSGGVIEPSDHYSFDDIAAQLAAEESASEQSRDK